MAFTFEPRLIHEAMLARVSILLGAVFFCLQAFGSAAAGPPGRGIARPLAPKSAYISDVDVGAEAVQLSGCPSSQAFCGGACRDLSTDERNCGACGLRCQPLESCAGGECQCLSPLAMCEGQCIDPQSDDQHCGACGVRCERSERCESGQCRLTCPSTQLACDNRTCVSPGTDPNHCGGCGKKCPEDFHCSGGKCERCSPEMTECGGLCRDTQNDRNHCGSCGKKCGPDLMCVDGSCSPMCGEFKKADPKPKPGEVQAPPKDQPKVESMCPAGSFSHTGKAPCEKCAPGSISTKTGSRSCRKCAPGTTPNAARRACVPSKK